MERNSPFFGGLVKKLRGASALRTGCRIFVQYTVGHYDWEGASYKHHPQLNGANQAGLAGPAQTNLIMISLLFHLLHLRKLDALIRSHLCVTSFLYLAIGILSLLHVLIATEVAV